MDQFSYRIGNKDVLIYRSIFTPVKSNMFVIFTGNEAVVFDPNVNGGLLSLLEERNIQKVHILLTHEHYDHTSGVNWLQNHTGADLYCQSDCARVIATERGNNPALIALVLASEDKQDGGHRYKDFKTTFRPYIIKADKTFYKEDAFTIGDLAFKVTSTPGHCPGSACYILNDDMVFTGDTLLQNDPVIIRFAESRKNIYEQIALPYLQSLKKTMIVMPGHGNPFVLSETNNI